MSLITCPQCSHQFNSDNIVREEVEKELRTKMVDWQKKREQEFSKQLQDKDALHLKQIADEKKQLQQQLEESLRKSIAGDYENRLSLLQKEKADNEEKLKESRQKELEFLKKENELKNKEADIEIQIQKQLNAEREKMSIQLKDQEKLRLEAIETDFKLRLAEKDKQIEDAKKLAEETIRKAQQGSMQLQGEVQELMLEDILQSAFPYDKIEPVGKGVRGADCIQIICNQFGQPCGKIIYESKRTKDFGGDWIEKLKADMRSTGADVAVIVTQALPKDMERFGEKDGVFICSFTEVKSLSNILRISILKTFTLTKSQEQKGDKVNMLYDYLTSNEFGDQWQAIREGFMSMRLSIQKERDAMEKLWKVREKQLEKVMINAAQIRGSIEGIAGNDAINLSLVDDNDLNLLD